MNNRSFICDKWAKRWYQIWGNPQVVLIQPKLKIGKLKLLRQNCCILPNSAKLSAARSLLPSCNFSATKRSTCSSYCLGAVPPPKKMAIKNIRENTEISKQRRIAHNSAQPSLHGLHYYPPCDCYSKSTAVWGTAVDFEWQSHGG